MNALICYLLPPAVMALWRWKIKGDKSNIVDLAVIYVVMVCLLNGFIVQILKYFFDNQGQITNKLNTYNSFALKYFILALTISIIEPFIESKIIQLVNHVKEKGITSRIPYVIILFLSIIIFLSIYGYRVLIPIYTDWLLAGGDLSQHYLGWQAFRNGDWMFPIGLTDQLAYPSTTSVIYTDSIPLFAVFFKLFKGILPAEFQYFGIWGLMCFFLMGALGYRLVLRFTKNVWYSIAASVLFMITPVMIWRMYGHTSLAGQWVILYALDVLFSQSKENTNHIWKKWMILGALCASIHIYFILICGVIIAGACIEELLRNKKISNAVKNIAAYVFSAVIVIALLGGFSSEMIYEAGGLGYFSYNLNALFNPLGWSKVLRDLPTYTGGQYEGFAYLGLGVIILFMISIFALLVSRKIRCVIRNHLALTISLSLIIIITTLLASSPIVSFNNTLIIEIPISEKISQLWSIFRSTGRLCWTIVYLIIILASIIVYKFIGRRSSNIIMVIVLIVQYCDISGVLEKKYENFSQNIVYNSALSDTKFWNKFADSGIYKHVILSQSFGSLPEEMGYSIANYALDHNMTLNSFYFARDNKTVENENRENSYANPNDSEMFFFWESNAFEILKHDLHYYSADGVIVGTVNEVPGLEEQSVYSLAMRTYSFGDQCVNNGEDLEDGTRRLYADGLSYGPYWSIPAGKYHVVITGSNLESCEVYSYSDKGNEVHTIEDISVSGGLISFTLIISKDSTSLEILVHNTSSENVDLSGIMVNAKG